MTEKSIVKNAIYNVIYRIVNLLFPLVSSIYISHILMAGGIGKVSKAQNIVQYFVLIAPLGITNYGTREIAKNRNETYLKSKIFTELFLINAISTICCTIIYYGIIFRFDWFASERLLFVVAGLPILFNIINIEWYYQGNEEYIYIALRSIVVKVISLIGILLFVKTAEDYVIYAFIYVFGITGNYIFNIINLHHKGIRLQFKDVKMLYHMKSILILLCSNIMVEFYTLLDITMLGVLCTDVIVGYYTNSVKLIKITVGLITAIGTVLLPRLSYNIVKQRKEECNMLISRVALIMFYFSIPCGIGIFILAEKLVYVMFGVSFMPAVITVRIATALIYVLGFSNLFGVQVLLTFGQEKKLLICTSLGAVSNMCMNALLIPMFQQNGAIIASVISETIVTIATLSFALKYIDLKIRVLDILKIIALGIFMGGVVVLVQKFISNNLLCLIVSFICGAGVYLSLSKVLKLMPFMIIWNTLLKRGFDQ